MPNQPDFSIVKLDDPVTTNGVGLTNQGVKVKIDVRDIKDSAYGWKHDSLKGLYFARFKLKMKNDGMPSWEYDPTIRYIEFTYNDKERTLKAQGFATPTGTDDYTTPEFTNAYTKVASSGGGYIAPSPVSVPEPVKFHPAYIKGYPDGAMRPAGDITRAETATMIYRLLPEERRAEIRTDNSIFRDMRAGAWYRESVSSMARGRYVFGYPDGTFGGDQPITRAEFVAMLVRFAEPAKGEKAFSDVAASHWAYTHIVAASAAGWVEGYENGRFEPDKNITRAEVVSILNRILNRGVNEKSTLLNFKNWQDNTVGSWYYYEMIEAGNSHEYTGARPSENWTKILD